METKRCKVCKKEIALEMFPVNKKLYGVRTGKKYRIPTCRSYTRALAQKKKFENFSYHVPLYNGG